MQLPQIFASLVVLLNAFLFGCDAPQSSSKTTSQSADMAPSVLKDAWSVLKKAQDTRLERLSTFLSSGQFTLRWYEDDGRRWEQLDMRVWWSLPDRMAIRLSNVGSRLALAGWNGRTWWVFDETGDEPRLSIFDMASRGTGENQLLSPPLLFCLAGLVSFPSTMPADFSVPARGAFRFTIPSVGFEVNDRVVSLGLAARFNLNSQGPQTVELIAADGTTVARSVLSNIKPVECRGQPQGAWPNMPYRVLVLMPSEKGKDSEAKLSFDRPIAGKKVPEKMFDLDALKNSIQPASVEDHRSVK